MRKKMAQKIVSNDEALDNVRRLKQRIALKKLEIDKKSKNNDLIVDRRDYAKLCELERQLNRIVKNIEKGVLNNDD